MQSNHTPFHCFVPAHILDHMLESSDPLIRRQAVDTIVVAAEARAVRATLRTLRSWLRSHPRQRPNIVRCTT